MSQHGNSQHGRKSFRWLMISQFQGAFSDNAFKALVAFLIIGSEASQGRGLVLLVGALFAVPFIVFSMTGGYLADRFSKRSVTLATKLLEIAVMTMGLAGLAFDNLPLKAAAVFLMSVQSALFSPSKFGLLPELLPERRLSWANGLIQLATFAAIIFGTVAGGWMSESFSASPTIPGVIFVVLGLMGLVAAMGIRPLQAANPGRRFRFNFVGEFAGQMRQLACDRTLLSAVVGSAYFFFLGALLQFNIFFFGIEVLQAGDTANSLLMAAIALGIGAGSLAAGYLSGEKIEAGLIPLGCAGMALTSALLYLPGISYLHTAGLLTGLGFFAGFFIVPVNALIQHRPPADQRGSVIAAANLLSMLGVLAASGVYYLLTAAGLSTPQIFLASALATMAVTMLALAWQPRLLVRTVLWLLTHSIYRLRVKGGHNLPALGGALLVSNHLSFVDGLMLMASTDRPIRFLVYKGYYEHPLIHPFFRLVNAIPISAAQNPRQMIRSLRNARQAIEQGELVCIFAEGQISRIGQLLPFQKGLERIMKGARQPIIPVYLDGLWGSLFSYERGRFLWKIPHRLVVPVAVRFGAPLPASTQAHQVRQTVEQLQAESWPQRQQRQSALHRSFVAGARRHPWRFAMADGRVKRLRFGGALLRAVVLARRLRPHWDGQQKVGILLPPSVAAALANHAALLMGKVPVNLNYTVSQQILESCLKQCNIRCLLTCREFLSKISVQVPQGIRLVAVEELVSSLGWTEKVYAALLAALAPVHLLERLLGRTRPARLDDLATVIFSSGSTGNPKGVMLSHGNIASNIDQVSQVFFLKGRDRVAGILPFFHSFGFTMTLAMPAVRGLGAVYHPNPLDARSVGALIQDYRATFLMATPTFLQSYLRRCTPGQLGSLRHVLAGAEKLSDSLASQFEDTFGIRPLEGYGTTECSPVVAVNTPGYRAPGMRQAGGRRGSIGRPLPGMSVRIVHPESREVLPQGESGLLLVKGPNVMQGYLGRPEKTARVLNDGWYATGDMAQMDQEGYLEISGRLSRFSKIGGEMVPHLKVEKALQELAEAEEPSFVVAGVPDERKGERLVVLHTLPEDRLGDCLQRLSSSGLPRLWAPRPGHFHRIDALPYLGTGKLDLARIQAIAQQAAKG